MPGMTFTSRIAGQGGRYELDPTIEKVLAEPAENEAALLDAVAKSGDANEAALKVAAAAARALQALTDAYGGRFPADVRKAVDAQLGVVTEPVAKREREPEPIAKTKRGLAHFDEETRTKMSPLWKAFTKKHGRPLPETPETLVAKAEKRLEEVAADIRKADHTLTKEQAYVKALDARPDLVRGLYGQA